MGILNKDQDGLLELVKSVDGLMRWRPEGIERKVLYNLVCPFGSTEMLEKTLKKWISLGYFKEENNTISLQTDLQNLEFSTAVERILFSDVNNSTLQENIIPANGWPGTTDFTVLASFLALLDVLDYPLNYNRISELGIKFNENGRDKEYVENLQRWSPFVEYAVELELGWGTTSRFFFEPSGFIRKYLKKIFDGRRELELKEFKNKLSALFPIFDGGYIMDAVAQSFSEELRNKIIIAQNDGFSSVISFALYRLRAKGSINLLRSIDVTGTAVKYFENERFSKITLTEEV